MPKRTGDDPVGEKESDPKVNKLYEHDLRGRPVHKNYTASYVPKFAAERVLSCGQGPQIGRPLHQTKNLRCVSELPEGLKFAQLTKLVCKVLSLDTVMADHMETLRCQLMRILSVEESSDAATWKPPIATCMLSHLFCDNCGQSGEIDVCQIPSLFDDEEERRAESDSAFGCSSCCHPYPKRVIERELVSRLNRLITAYTVQDHKCGKCGNIRQDQMATYCDCSSPYRNTIGYEEMEMHLKIIFRIAEQNNLGKLFRASKWVLEAEFPKSRELA
uniref:DNA polymerase epsilon catalytic subunit n=1 Tax=Steinernema glaseri TaxID=37863 RepID=A0A1I7YZL2_9BILA